jgi:UDP-glucose 4-epimerase
VTGGAGFIGSNVADRFLGLGHEVAVFDDLSTGFREFVNPRAGFFEATSPTPRRWTRVWPRSSPRWSAVTPRRSTCASPCRIRSGMARVNVLGSIGLLQACTRHGVRKVLYASTGGALYGEGRQLPATEDHPVNPEAPYGISKHTVEHYLYLSNCCTGSTTRCCAIRTCSDRARIRMARRA